MSRRPHTSPPAAAYPQYYPPAGQIPIMAAPPEVPKHHGAALVGGHYWRCALRALVYRHARSAKPASANTAAGRRTAGNRTECRDSRASRPTPQMVERGQWRSPSLQPTMGEQLRRRPFQSADLECDQYDHDRRRFGLQKHVSLTRIECQTGGAVKPGTTEAFRRPRSRRRCNGPDQSQFVEL